MVWVLTSEKGKGKDAVVSQAIEPVGGYTTESVTHGQCNARPTFPATEHHRPIAHWLVPIYTAW